MLVHDTAFVGLEDMDAPPEVFMETQPKTSMSDPGVVHSSE